MSTIRIGTPGNFFEPRFNSFMWVMDPDTGWRKCAGMSGEFLHGKTPLELSNIISLSGHPITRVEIANTLGKKGMFLFDREGSIVAHVVDAQIASDDVDMDRRAQVILKFLDVTDATIRQVRSGIAGRRYDIAIVSREPQEEFDHDVLTDGKTMRSYWAHWFAG